MAKVSIIVPVYNVEKYIEDCLNSLTSQSLKDIEIICINDGSTDKSGEIIEKIAKQDKRIKLIKQENGGRSVARNAGLKAVSTKYVMFCDADDCFEKTMCEKMVEKIEKSDVDVVVCGLEIKYENHEEQARSDEIYYRVKFRGRNYIDDNIIMKTDASVCNKIFRMDLINKYNISFPDRLNNEDYYFYNAYMSVAQTADFISQKLYKYIRHEGSIMSENFDKNTYSPDHLEVAMKLFSFYKKTGFLKDHLNLFWTQFAESYWFSYFHSARKSQAKIHKLGKDFILKYYDRFTPSNSKVRARVMSIRYNNIYYKVIRRVKSLTVGSFRKLNLAYRQQEVINRYINNLENKMDELERQIDDILEEKNGN